MYCGAPLMRPVLLLMASAARPRSGLLRRASNPLASLASGSDVRLSVHFERPVRRWLTKPGSTHRISVPAEASLDELRSLLAPSLAADPEAFRLLHGKRLITTDHELKAVLDVAQAREVEPQLRVAPPIDEDELPPPPAEAVGRARWPAPAVDEGERLQMLSFFTFHPTEACEQAVSKLVAEIDEALEGAGALGSVYVASTASSPSRSARWVSWPRGSRRWAAASWRRCS
jgi:hypothetical protein